VRRTIPGREETPQRKPGTPWKTWNPEFAEAIPWYPKTPEAFAEWQQRKSERARRLHAEGRFVRRGIPDGFGGRKDEVIRIRQTARAEAREIVAYMKKNDMIAEDPRAEEALESMIEVVRAKDDEGMHLHGVQHRIAAARTVLDFTKQRPATKSDVTLTKAEDFLSAVVADMTAPKD
jgi:hypothetical protein